MRGPPVHGVPERTESCESLAPIFLFRPLRVAVICPVGCQGGCQAAQKMGCLSPRDRLAVRLVAQTVEPLPDEEAKAKKRAALIKEIGASVLSVEDQVDALRERLARGMQP